MAFMDLFELMEISMGENALSTLKIDVKLLEIRWLGKFEHFLTSISFIMYKAGFWKDQ